MSTDKLRVQAYLHSDIYYQFDRERMSLGLTQSQALEKILIERYGAANKPENPKPESLDWIRSAFKDLQERVSKLELDSELFSESFSESVSDTPNEMLSQIIGEINHEVRVSPLEGELNGELESDSLGKLKGKLESELESDLSSELNSELNSELPGGSSSELNGELEHGISQLSLAQRLGCSDRYLRKLEKQGKLLEWSKQKDPDQISWELRNKKYYPRSVKLQESAV